MSRMGADGYSSADTTRLSAKVPDGLKRDFRDACDNAGVTMTDAVEEFMADFVAEHGPAHVDTSDGYYPDDPDERALYEACLDAADHTDEGPKLHQRRHARRVAKTTQDVSKDELADALMPLRRKGYVALGYIPAYAGGETADRWRYWYVKPVCADPEQWTKREGDR